VGTSENAGPRTTTKKFTGGKREIFCTSNGTVGGEEWEPRNLEENYWIRERVSTRDEGNLADPTIPAGEKGTKGQK